MSVMLGFRPIDLADKADLQMAYDHRQDVLDVNQGRAGHEQPLADYMDWLSGRAALNANYVVFALDGSRIAGQLEIGPANESGKGYINLVYLVADYRCQRLGEQLLQRAEKTLSNDGFHAVRLTSFALNQRNTDFYSRNGYQCLGPRPKLENFLLWEKQLNA